MGILSRVKDLKQSIEFKRAEREAKKLEKMNKKLKELKKKESRADARTSRKAKKKQLQDEIDRIENKVSTQRKITRRAITELTATGKEIKNSKTFKETIKELKSGLSLGTSPKKSTTRKKKKKKKKKKTTKKKGGKK